MMQQVLSHYHLPLLAGVGLGIFMAVFLGALVWVCRPGSDGFYRELEAQPLANETGANGGVEK